MVAGRVTGGADLADLVHLADGLTLADQDAGHVGVQRPGAVRVGDHHIVSVGRTILRDHHHPGLRGHDRRAIGRGNVDAPVQIPPPGDGVGPPAEGRCDPVGAGDGPEEPGSTRRCLAALAAGGTAATGGRRTAALLLLLLYIL